MPHFPRPLKRLDSPALPIHSPLGTWGVHSSFGQHAYVLAFGNGMATPLLANTFPIGTAGQLTKKTRITIRPNPIPLFAPVTRAILFDESCIFSFLLRG